MNLNRSKGMDSAIKSTRQRRWLRPHWARKISRKLVRSESGAAMVEMAIASIAFFMVVFGLIYIGFALYVYDFISDAAREGARYAIVRGSDCTGFAECTSTTIPNGATTTQIGDFVKSLHYPGIVPSKMTVNVKWYAYTAFTSTTATSYSLCGTTGTAQTYTNASGVLVACNAPGNSVQVQVIYQLPFSIPFWRATTLTMGSATELTIAQ